VADSFSTPVSFNKYSGVQEWGNDVLYLWINFDTPNSEVVNEFHEDGRRVNWYGGSKMHDETNVIQKLKRVGIRASNDIDNLNGAVVLWCRRYHKEKKNFGSYVCLGRLSVRIGCMGICAV
jgi:hypothetical protein